MWKKRIKFGAAIGVALLAILIVLQNTESVETRILTFSLILPRALLLFFTLVTGFVLGLGTAWLWNNKRLPKKSPEVTPPT